MTNKFTIEDLSAYLDGELEPARRVALAIALDRDEDLKSQLHRLADVDSNVREYCDPIISAPIPDHLLATVQQSSKSREPRVDWRQALHALLRPVSLGTAAVALVAGLLIGQSGTITQDPLMVATKDRLVAGPTLASFLDTATSGQVQIVDQADSVIRLSLSTESGKHCRQFQVGSLSGLACKIDDAWALQAVVEGNRLTSEQYALASSDVSPAIQTAITGLDGVKILDSDQEREAITADWK